jgi:hypothetical protein
MSTAWASNWRRDLRFAKKEVEMHPVLNFRKSGVFWWGVIAALVFLIPGAWLLALAAFLRSADWLQENQPPVSWLNNLRDTIDKFALSLPTMVQFKPGESLVVVGPLQVPNLVIGILAGLLLMVVAFIFYLRASASPGVLDDLFAMLFFYIVLRVEGAATAAVPVVKTLNDQAPQSYLIILLLIMLINIVRGRAAHDSAVFFKVLMEAILVAVLILPRQTLEALAWIVERPTMIHSFLAGTGYFVSIEAIWALIGILLGIMSLYNIAKTPQRPPTKATAGGGGGGERKSDK